MIIRPHTGEALWHFRLAERGFQLLLKKNHSSQHFCHVFLGSVKGHFTFLRENLIFNELQAQHSIWFLSVTGKDQNHSFNPDCQGL